MTILDILRNKGIEANKVSNSKGGEYHSPCPGCGGNDRFIVWVDQNRYYCRQCRKSGDLIQFYRDFEGVSFKEAKSKASKLPNKQDNRKSSSSISLSPIEPSVQWISQADKLIVEAHNSLLVSDKCIETLLKRGLSLDSIKKYSLGWVEKDLWISPQEWGLKKEGKLWIPRGHLIPTFFNFLPLKLKIRTDTNQPDKKLAKYVEVPGSYQKLSIYGDMHRPVVLLESEFDAMLLQQFASDFCSCIALGGASKKPDKNLFMELQKCPLILYSLDYDQAGVNAFQWWYKNFQNLKVWMPPEEKSPGDAFKLGTNLRNWVYLGINRK
ncbi:MAG: hypothetical protein COT84_08470 [Chlamydiae bacterium CG10_big_fil_rev_8_21_14_0_10_35_9]|nr:MAG: hypothetical protein COT84_08470 [Chlamydiae bacterium CG10_big_fil_rev_8_21_14_0_10_35_9]